MSTPTNPTPYELLGGEPAVRRLVHRFYELMDELPEAYEVRKLHPESLDNSEQNLFEYLYAVTPSAKDEWMMCMTQSLAENVPGAALRDSLHAAFAGLAEHMVNTN
jgi:hemoglobin